MRNGCIWFLLNISLSTISSEACGATHGRWQSQCCPLASLHAYPCPGRSILFISRFWLERVTGSIVLHVACRSCDVTCWFILPWSLSQDLFPFPSQCILLGQEGLSLFLQPPPHQNEPGLAHSGGGNPQKPGSSCQKGDLSQPSPAEYSHPREPESLVTTVLQNYRGLDLTAAEKGVGYVSS